MLKVSVIVPVYNTEKYLSKCLDSLVYQTLKDIEIIIVNDGSPDNSQKVIDEYVSKYSNVFGYKKENGGLSDARNYGISKAKGKYIIFIDSDDYIECTMLEKMYDYAKKNSLDIVTCNSVKVYENNNIKIELKSNLKYSDDDIKNYLLAPPMVGIRIFKRDLFDNILFKKGIYYEDLELVPKLVKYTKKIGFIDEGLLYYLQREGSIMHQQQFNHKLLDIFNVLESNKKELIDTYYEEIEYMYITHLLRTGTLRFLEYDDSKKYLLKIYDIMKEQFPSWKNNMYYKKSSWKLKLICNLSYKRKYILLKIIKKIFER